MARCPHRNVQGFTEICLDCGRNVYETDEQYLAHLRQEKARRQQEEGSTATAREIEDLERELGLKRR